MPRISKALRDEQAAQDLSKSESAAEAAWPNNVFEIMREGSAVGFMFKVSKDGNVQMLDSSNIVHGEFSYSFVPGWEAEWNLIQSKSAVEHELARQEAAQRLRQLRAQAKSKLSSEEWAALTGLDGAYD